MSSDYYSSLAGSSSLTPSNAPTATNGSNNAGTSTRWLAEEMFALIDVVQGNEAIYNSLDKYYFCRPYVENFWREVDLKLKKTPGASLAKWTNLRTSFRREYTNYLVEKIRRDPCWTYFDRMFFLHPYLRIKHQQTKSLDSQVLTYRLQRERTLASASDYYSCNQPNNVPSTSQPQLDNYLEYFDDHDRIPLELDDMIDDEPPNPSQFSHSTFASDIKSECEDNADEYDTVEHPVDDVDHDADMRNYMYKALQKQHQKPQHLERLQSRSFHEEFRNKRSRSHDNICSSQSYTTPHSNNVSFVRPTFAKPLKVVSTTTQSHESNGNSNNNLNNLSSTTSNVSLPKDEEPASNSTPRSGSSQHHQNPRFEMFGLNAKPNVPPIPPTIALKHHSNMATTPAFGAVASAAATPELCDCKTDPDVMFLMSLLPDIQKLNGRDRGKIKIAFQNILQGYLYPD